jgi:hypothetical protein
MVQFGQNAGPRHLRVFGLVRNLKDKNLPIDSLLEKDHRLLGAFGMVWNLFLSITPAPVIEVCNAAMDDVGIPRMQAEGDDRRKFSSFFKKKNHIYPADEFSRTWLYSRIGAGTCHL